MLACFLAPVLVIFTSDEATSSSNGVGVLFWAGSLRVALFTLFMLGGFAVERKKAVMTSSIWWWGTEGARRARTVRLVVEEVVVLGDVCDDAEPIGDSHGDHVFWIQQGRNPQLGLGHVECLETRISSEKLSDH